MRQRRFSRAQGPPPWLLLWPVLVQLAQSTVADPPEPPAAETTTPATAEPTPAPVPYESLSVTIPALTKQRLNATFGPAVLKLVTKCDNALTTEYCDNYLLQTMEEIGEHVIEVREKFAACPSGCAFQQSDCDDFWQLMEVSIPAWHEGCSGMEALNFPEECEEMVTAFSDALQNPRFDLPVKCGIISSGNDQQRLPQCLALAETTVALRPTLVGSPCGSWSKVECEQHFCDLYKEFRWWIRPRNLQEDIAPYLYDDDFILPGCENVVQHDFIEEDCPLRGDILGFCDCLCHTDLPQLPLHLYKPEPILEQPNCPYNMDLYLLYGRIGVAGGELHEECEDSLCTVFDTYHETAQCAHLDLPDMLECKAMELPDVGSASCPWLSDSGEVNVIECLDGHRCNIEEETWSCCEDSGHIGRGKCPSNLPQMCNEICGGATGNAYCCQVEGYCEPRGCSPVLLANPPILYPTTTTTTTTPIVESEEEEGFSLNVRLPEGWEVWLALFIPGLLLLCVLAAWLYYRARGWHHPEGNDTIEENQDKYGVFHIVRSKRTHQDDAVRGVMVYILVEDLPSERPLGLELVETKVERVHPRGARAGWHVGDVIREIAGVPVETFEDVWKRIQIERDRAPTKFLVERFDFSEEASKPIAPDGPMGIPRASKSKIAPAPLADGTTLTGTVATQLADGGQVPSAVLGWEAWAVAPAPAPEPAAEDLPSQLEAAGAASTRQAEERKRLEAAMKRREAVEAWKAEDVARKSAYGEDADYDDGDDPGQTLDGTTSSEFSRLKRQRTSLKIYSNHRGGSEDDLDKTAESEQSVADRVQRSYHHQRHRPRGKAPKEEVRWSTDTWGRAVQVFV